MGGIFAKALAVSPGEVFWKAALTVPPDSLVLSGEDRAILRDAFEWQADPTIRRLVYIAVPHRGSERADSPVGRLGSLIIRPPGGFTAFFRRVSEANPGAFTPAFARMGNGVLDSLDSLSPGQPVLQILADLPYDHPVVLHTIIGNRGRPGPLSESSDGYVAYRSSHLPEAVSEFLVADDHSLFRHPQTRQEVCRILRGP
jgi:hypothetical protein